jgi:hypothetical protein
VFVASEIDKRNRFYFSPFVGLLATQICRGKTREVSLVMVPPGDGRATLPARSSLDISSDAVLNILTKSKRHVSDELSSVCVVHSCTTLGSASPPSHVAEHSTASCFGSGIMSQVVLQDFAGNRKQRGRVAIR